MICRACGAEETRLVLDRTGPGVTSLAAARAVPTRLHACATCGHLSSPSLADGATYYEGEYDTVSGDEEDLMGYDEGGRPILRLQRQGATVLEHVDLPVRGRLLDFGCGHGVFMRRFGTYRPQWTTCGYEVSGRYAAPDVSIGRVPEGPFDLITCFYVLEHVEDPGHVLLDLAGRLAPDGALVLTVPNALANPGDALCVDHLSHFTRTSLAHALARGGLALSLCHEAALPGTWLVVARTEQAAGPLPAASLEEGTALGTYWRDADEALDAFLAEETLAPGTVAIYGAGVYGAWLRSCAALPDASVACFLDRNPRKQGTTFCGAPVVRPEEMPETVRTVLLGVGPDAAESALAPPLIAGRRCFSLRPWRSTCSV